MSNLNKMVSALTITNDKNDQDNHDPHHDTSQKTQQDDEN